MSWNEFLAYAILFNTWLHHNAASLVIGAYGSIRPYYTRLVPYGNRRCGAMPLSFPLFNTNFHSEDDGEDDDDEDITDAYGSRSLSWTKRYRALLPYEYARRRVLSLGLQSKAEWDEYVSDGKRGNGAYLPNRPDLMYSLEWQGWDEFLGVLRTYPETRHMVQHILKIRSRLTYEVFIYENPKRAELLRIPALPWIVYENKGWIDDYDFFGCSENEGINESDDLSL